MIFWFTNPFNINDKDNLYCISSGARVPKDHDNDILSAELKTMEDMGKKVKVRTANNKMVKYRQQGSIAMQLLVRSQTPELNIDLADPMRYPLIPVPFNIGTLLNLTSLRV